MLIDNIDSILMGLRADEDEEKKDYCLYLLKEMCLCGGGRTKM